MTHEPWTPTTQNRHDRPWTTQTTHHQDKSPAAHKWPQQCTKQPPITHKSPPAMRSAHSNHLQMTTTLDNTKWGWLPTNDNNCMPSKPPNDEEHSPKPFTNNDCPLHKMCTTHHEQPTNNMERPPQSPTLGCMLCTLATFWSSQAAQQCRLTLALPLWGSLVNSGGIMLHRLGYLWVFVNPLPIPAKTHTCGCGYGFWQVWAQVTLENPRVAHGIPYWPQRAVLISHTTLEVCSTVSTL